MLWFLELLLIAIGLSMDAFAVSVSNGIITKEKLPETALKTGLYFGVFQGVMPFIGWLLGTTVYEYIIEFDHWLAFVLLGIIGAKMIHGSFSQKQDQDKNKAQNLLLLAIATSIDALAVGISLAFLNEPILVSCLTIAIVTFTISYAGVFIGKKLGGLFKKWAQVIGGAVLILIGLKILLEHLLA